MMGTRNNSLVQKALNNLMEIAQTEVNLITIKIQVATGDIQMMKKNW